MTRAKLCGGTVSRAAVGSESQSRTASSSTECLGRLRYLGAIRVDTDGDCGGKGITWAPGFPGFEISKMDSRSQCDLPALVLDH